MFLQNIETSVWIAQLSTQSPLTVSLWVLVIFILWTITIVVSLVAVRVRHLAKGGSPKDFGTPNDESLLWRLFRVQSNLAENLPLYLGVVILLTVRGLSGAVVDALSVVYISSRIFHSAVHIAGMNPNLRILALATQFSCLLGLIYLAIAAATRT